MKRAFVIGHPIAHSRSPLIHRHWLARHGVEGSYDAIDVPPAQLAAFVDRLRQGDFVGGNVTIPHKQAVFDLCDSVDPLAETIGAVNTLVAGPGGVHGFNTDFMGFLGNLDQAAPGWDRALREAVILGAGGAARAVAVALRERGIGRIHVLNRSPDKAEILAREIAGPFVPAPLSAFPTIAAGAGLLVNTTSIGMHGTAFDSLPLKLLPAGAVVNDLVYVPLETPLLAAARQLGLTAVDGLGMLLHQATPGFEAWFGVRPEVTPDLRKTIEAAL